jgi:Winged helix-turn helix
MGTEASMPLPFGSRIDLPVDVRGQLEALVRAESTPQALVFRCRVVLRAAAADQPTIQTSAQELDCDRHPIGQWRERFASYGLAGLQDAPRSGRPRSFSPARPRRGPLDHCGKNRNP